jgi:hypothetical protein
MEDPMNRSSIIALVIGALLFGCGAGMVASEVLESEADAQVAWIGQQWEYKCFQRDVSVYHLTTDEGIGWLDERGSNGWELVALPEDHACFKRPLP